jgi:hypothetical protein
MIDQNYYSAALCTACQDYFLRATAPDLSGALPKRIYISRENFTTPRRRVANYEEFKSVLQEFDITPVVLDGMSGIQQIQLLRNAEVVVGVHGAGLSNILFCPPECRIVILDNERNINVKMVGMFSGLASVLGLEHRVVKVGEESREGFDYENFHYLHNRDVIVDFDEFRRVMAETLADQKTRLTRSNDVSDCLFGTSTALSGSAGSTVAAPESGSRTAETPRTFMARWWKLLASR